MFLINILLFLFLFILISGIITVVRIVWRIRQMHRQMKEQFGQGTASARNRQTHTSSRQTTNGETITDTRDPQKANRKVIADDEGEYIDFVEEK